MRNLIVLALLAILFSTKGQAQDFQGKAIYQSKTQVNMDFGGRQIPEDRKKEILERMKKANEKVYELNFNQIESLYTEEERLEQPGGQDGGGRGPRFGALAGSEGPFYKNIKEQKYLVKNDLYGKIFLVEDSLETLDWKLGDETKQIGNYTAFKATATKTIKRPNMRAIFRRGGRNDEDKEEEKEEEFIIKEVEVVAWYTPEIPVNQGPSSYWGLPGLILAVSDDITTIVCSQITLNPSEKIEIKAPSKGKKVTQAEYDQIAQEKTKEMRENFRNRRRGGGGPGRS